MKTVLNVVLTLKVFDDAGNSFTVNNGVVLRLR